MKKVLLLLTVFTAFLLAACGTEEAKECNEGYELRGSICYEIQPEEVDCTETPDLEECQEPEVKCDETPNHEECQEPEVNCDETPNHEECQEPEVNCDETPNHEECQEPEVNCDETPNHEECQEPEVNCDETPNHVECQEPEVTYYCEANDTECMTLVENLISTMTLREKAAQMVQAERGNITPNEVKSYGIGSILSGGGSHPSNYMNTANDWYNMYADYQNNALDSSTGIPIIYGIDAVHGNNNLYGATIFPHNIGLGAANDPALMYEIGKATAEEMLVTGIQWNFAPAMSVVQDIRWGRTYEGFSEKTEDHNFLVPSIIQGMEENGVSATAKHYLGDGGTAYGIDRGNTVGNEALIRELHLPPYIESVNVGVDTIMISYSSIQNEKMHEQAYWINDVLKGELDYQGFIISDWEAIHELPGDFTNQVALSINAGVDMLMEPNMWREAIDAIETNVNNNAISMERVDDAVRRILTVKYNRGLFDDPLYRLDVSNLADDEHLAVAREAVRKSLVLLQNNNDSLPLNNTEKVYITGPGANSIALQNGGWSTHWQGGYSNFWSWNYDLLDNNELGAGIGIEDAIMEYLSSFDGQLVNTPQEADTIIVVLAEYPYAEWFGDNTNMTLTGGNAHQENAGALLTAAQYNPTKNVVGILLSGRPLLLEDHLSSFDSFIAAWLPGSEGGHGITDVIYGDYDFTGSLTFTWPLYYSQMGYNSNDTDYDPNSVLFPYGYGLNYTD